MIKSRVSVTRAVVNTVYVWQHFSSVFNLKMFQNCLIKTQNFCINANSMDDSSLKNILFYRVSGVVLVRRSEKNLHVM